LFPICLPRLVQCALSVFFFGFPFILMHLLFSCPLFFLLTHSLIRLHTRAGEECGNQLLMKQNTPPADLVMHRHSANIAIIQRRDWHRVRRLRATKTSRRAPQNTNLATDLLRRCDCELEVLLDDMDVKDDANDDDSDAREEAFELDADRLPLHTPHQCSRSSSPLGGFRVWTAGSAQANTASDLWQDIIMCRSRNLSSSGNSGASGGGRHLQAARLRRCNFSSSTCREHAPRISPRRGAARMRCAVHPRLRTGTTRLSP